jgi:hypothetical protein
MEIDMGVEYWLVDKSKKTFYDLGKGSWGWSWDDFSWALSDVDVLKEALCGVWQETRRFRAVPMLPDDYNYVWWLAEDLHKHFGESHEADMVVVPDGGDEMTIIRSKGYRGLGSRYLHKPTDEEREKEMKDLNRHFDANGNITRFYDPNDLQTYPGFDDW